MTLRARSFAKIWDGRALCVATRGSGLGARPFSDGFGGFGGVVPLDMSRPSQMLARLEQKPHMFFNISNLWVHV